MSSKLLAKIGEGILIGVAAGNSSPMKLFDKDGNLVGKCTDNLDGRIGLVANFEQVGNASR